MSDAGVQSWWWCRRCHAYVDLVDPGDPFPQCEHCGSRHVEVREPEPDSKPVDGRTVAAFNRQPQIVSVEARPITRVKKHLPEDKKDLRKLVRTGFWFCYADDCRQITERNEMGECVCCGAVLEEETNWTPPALPSEGEEAAA